MKITRTQHDLELVKDKRARAIVEILLRHQDKLSDGYGYYCEYLASEEAAEFYNDDRVLAALAVIAEEILKGVE